MTLYCWTTSVCCIHNKVVVLIVGVVNEFPVAIGPPLLEVYQFTPAFEAVAFRVTGPEPQIELSRALYPRDHDSGTLQKSIE
jgi:hypothetical protein